MAQLSRLDALKKAADRAVAAANSPSGRRAIAMAKRASKNKAVQAAALGALAKAKASLSSRRDARTGRPSRRRGS